MQRLAVATGLVLLATAVTGQEAEAQRGRGRNRGAPLPTLSCPGAVANDFATAAQDALNRAMIPGRGQQGFLETALEQSSAGLAADSANPYHHHQRAQALLKLADFNGETAGTAYTALFPQSTTISASEALAAGASAFNRAVALCPELGADRSDLERAAQITFNLANERYEQGDTVAAIALWQAVSAADSTNVDAVFNAALAASQRNDHATAFPLLQRVLAITSAEDTARTEQRAATLSLMMVAGGNLFQQEKFAEAGEVYGFIHTTDPSNRDAWYNHALALYKLERWQELIPVAARVVEMDPLNYNAQIVLFNAYKGVADAARAANDEATEDRNRTLAVATVARADSLPVAIDNISFDPEEGAVVVKGVATGGTAAAGTPIQLEFTLTDVAGEVGRGTVSIPAPAKEQTANFEVRVPVTRTATSYTYRKL